MESKALDIPVQVYYQGNNYKSLANLKQYRVGSVPLPGKPYTGGFPVRVIEIIKSIIPGPGAGRVLHLYSGRSDIGDVRIDLECEEATRNMSVESFTAQDNSTWDWILLDPPYRLIDTSTLKDYADARPLSGSALLRDRLCLYFRHHANNILWLDYCSPLLKGFTRARLWFFIPPRVFENVRCLTWLKRNQGEMPISVGGIDLT